MRKLLSVVSVAALASIAGAGAAQAQGPFIEGSVGITDSDSLDWAGFGYDTDQGKSAALAVGRTFWNHWDGEVQLSYDKMEYSCCNPNNTHEWRLMANLTRTFDLSSSWALYAGGGIGAATVTYENPSYSRSDTVAAWQGIGGVRWSITPEWSVYGEYRYQDTFSDPEDQGLEWEHKSNNFALGVRYTFQ